MVQNGAVGTRVLVHRTSVARVVRTRAQFDGRTTSPAAASNTFGTKCDRLVGAIHARHGSRTKINSFFPIFLILNVKTKRKKKIKKIRSETSVYWVLKVPIDDSKKRSFRFVQTLHRSKWLSWCVLCASRIWFKLFSVPLFGLGSIWSKWHISE